MSSIFNSLMRLYLQNRYKRVSRMLDSSVSLQKGTLKSLLERGKSTEYGRLYNFQSIKSHVDYCNTVPVVDYDTIKGYIGRMMEGEGNVLWPDKFQWFAKSSGTTDRSKYLPVSNHSHRRNHSACGWDTIATLYHNHPDCEIFARKCLIMGGSLQPYNGRQDIMVGDVSAILIKRFPAVVRPFYTPDFDTALMDDWEEKLDKMAHLCKDEDVVMFGGVPTWTIVLFNKILDITGKKNMSEVWPNAAFYLHGGVGFDPYRAQFQEFFPEKLNYYEVYNASEGYFAAKVRADDEGMLLMTDNDVYFEFVPVEYAEEEYPVSIPLADVEVGIDYALVITTASGLWRYKIGDTIRFTSKEPYKIVVSGRTKHYINVFGEEVMIGNTDEALAMTINELPAIVSDYTVGPIFLDEASGGHHWVIEFEKHPDDIEKFAALLDQNLQSINSDYAAKRHKNIALKPLKVDVVPKGKFFSWMKERGKLGGQHKVPRLHNTRHYVDQLLEIS